MDNNFHKVLFYRDLFLGSLNYSEGDFCRVIANFRTDYHLNKYVLFLLIINLTFGIFLFFFFLVFCELNKKFHTYKSFLITSLALVIMTILGTIRTTAFILLESRELDWIFTKTLSIINYFFIYLFEKSLMHVILVMILVICLQRLSLLSPCHSLKVLSHVRNFAAAICIIDYLSDFTFYFTLHVEVWFQCGSKAYYMKIFKPSISHFSMYLYAFNNALKAMTAFIILLTSLYMSYVYRNYLKRKFTLKRSAIIAASNSRQVASLKSKTKLLAKYTFVVTMLVTTLLIFLCLFIYTFLINMYTVRNFKQRSFSHQNRSIVILESLNIVLWSEIVFILSISLVDKNFKKEFCSLFKKCTLQTSINAQS